MTEESKTLIRSVVAKHLLAQTGYEVTFSVEPFTAKMMAELLPELFAESRDMEVLVDAERRTVTLKRKKIEQVPYDG